MVEVLSYLAPRQSPESGSGVGVYEFVQDDGAKWHGYFDERLPDSHYLIVTSIGREMINGYAGIEAGRLPDLFNEYRATEPDTNGTMRDFLGSGQSAEVYGMGDHIAVREEGGKRPFMSAVSELTIMDRLSTVVEEGIPYWLSVPSYYAFYCDPQANRQYTFMERIDSGLTVEDVLTYPQDLRPGANDRVEQELGENIEDSAEEVSTLFMRSKEILEAVIRAKGQNPNDLLLDWAARNVLVKRLRTPVAGKNFKLSVIDQN